MDYTSLVLSQCRSISWKVPEARMLKDRCRQLGQRVNAVEEMVRALQSRATEAPQVGGALQKLYNTLMGADDLVQRCTTNRTANKSKYKNEFTTIDQRIQDSMRVLATVPHSSHRSSTSHASSSSRDPSTSHAPAATRAPAPSRALPPSYESNASRALPIRHAPSASRAVQRYVVEEVDDDSVEDLGVLVPYTVRGAARPGAHSRRGYQASMVVMEDGTLVYTEHIPGNR